MTEKKTDRANTTLNFSKKLKVYEWLKANWAEFVDMNYSSQQVADRAGKELNMPEVTKAHVRTVATELGYDWSHAAADGNHLVGVSKSQKDIIQKLGKAEVRVTQLEGRLTEEEAKSTYLDKTLANLIDRVAHLEKELGVKNLKAFLPPAPTPPGGPATTAKPKAM